MDRGGFDRVFSDSGYVSKSLQVRYQYDFDAIRLILEPLGKWELILDADDKKMKQLLDDLAPDIRQKIMELGIKTKEFIMLKSVMKRMKEPDDGSQTKKD